jgi:hypothetical protein
LCGGEPHSLPTNVRLPKWHEQIMRHRQLKPRPSRPVAEVIIVKEPELKTLVKLSVAAPPAAGGLRFIPTTHAKMVHSSHHLIARKSLGG